MYDKNKLVSNLCLEVVEKQPNLNNPVVLAKLEELLAKEMQFFDRMKIQRRKDGSFWTCYAATPTEEQIDAAISRNGQAYIHNRGQLVFWAEEQLRLGKLKKLHLVTKQRMLEYLQDYRKIWGGIMESSPGDIGHLENFRVKQYPTHREIHCDVKLRRPYEELGPLKDFPITNGVFTTSQDLPFWKTMHLREVIAAYINEPDKDKRGFLEAIGRNLFTHVREMLLDLDQK